MIFFPTLKGGSCPFPAVLSTWIVTKNIHVFNSSHAMPQNQWVPIRIKQTKWCLAVYSSLIPACVLGKTELLSVHSSCYASPSAREPRHPCSPRAELYSSRGPRCAGEELPWGGDWALQGLHMCCSPQSFCPHWVPSAWTAASVLQQPTSRTNEFLVWASQYLGILCSPAVVCFTLVY